MICRHKAELAEKALLNYILQNSARNKIGNSHEYLSNKIEVIVLRPEETGPVPILGLVATSWEKSSKISYLLYCNLLNDIRNILKTRFSQK